MSKEKVNADGVVRPVIYKEHNRRRPVVPQGTPRVKSEFKDQCDINRIVARIKKTGDMSALNPERQWQALDISDVPNNYTDAMLLTISVRDKFMNLPSEVRQQFHNDPQKWINQLQADLKASQEAADAAQKAAAEEALEEAAYRKRRRQVSPDPQEGGKIKT